MEKIGGMEKVGDIMKRVLKTFDEYKNKDCKNCEGVFKRKEIGFICKKHDILVDKEVCPKLNEVIEQAIKKEVEKKQKEEQKHKPQLIIKAEIPKRYWNATGNDKTVCIRIIKKFMADNKQFLVLAGGSGRGKTYASCWYLIKNISESCLYLDVITFYNRLKKDTYYLEEIKDIDYLVIDDVGKEQHKAETGFFQSFFDELINYRYNNLLPLVMATRLPGELFKGRYSDQTIGKIREVGDFFTTTEKSYNREGLNSSSKLEEK